ncbi:MAG: SPOR domain-containing protein [Pseudomonadota bacterium]
MKLHVFRFLSKTKIHFAVGALFLIGLVGQASAACVQTVERDQDGRSFSYKLDDEVASSPEKMEELLNELRAQRDETRDAKGIRSFYKGFTDLTGRTAETIIASNVLIAATPYYKVNSAEPFINFVQCHLDEAVSRAKAGAKKTNSDPFLYFLQAGAFTTPRDAEIMRTKLSSMGVEALISESEQSGRSIYRVRVGPFGDKAAADRMKNRLDGGGIQSALVRSQKLDDNAGTSTGKSSMAPDQVAANSRRKSSSDGGSTASEKANPKPGRGEKKEGDQIVYTSRDNECLRQGRDESGRVTYTNVCSVLVGFGYCHVVAKSHQDGSICRAKKSEFTRTGYNYVTQSGGLKPGETTNEAYAYDGNQYTFLVACKNSFPYIDKFDSQTITAASRANVGCWSLRKGDAKR